LMVIRDSSDFMHRESNLRDGDVQAAGQLAISKEAAHDDSAEFVQETPEPNRLRTTFPPPLSCDPL
jgi:hypothetical protein